MSHHPVLPGRWTCAGGDEAAAGARAQGARNDQCAAGRAGGQAGLRRQRRADADAGRADLARRQATPDRPGRHPRAGPAGGGGGGRRAGVAGWEAGRGAPGTEAEGERGGEAVLRRRRVRVDPAGARGQDQEAGEAAAATQGGAGRDQRPARRVPGREGAALCQLRSAANSHCWSGCARVRLCACRVGFRRRRRRRCVLPSGRRRAVAAHRRRRGGRTTT